MQKKNTDWFNNTHNHYILSILFFKWLLVSLTLHRWPTWKTSDCLYKLSLFNNQSIAFCVFGLYWSKIKNKTFYFKLISLSWKHLTGQCVRKSKKKTCKKCKNFYIKKTSIVKQLETHVPERHFCSDLYYHDIKTDIVIEVYLIRYVHVPVFRIQVLFYLHFCSESSSELNNLCI